MIHKTHLTSVEYNGILGTSPCSSPEGPENLQLWSSFFLQGCPRDDLFNMAGFRECSELIELKDSWILLLFFAHGVPSWFACELRFFLVNFQVD